MMMRKFLCIILIAFLINIISTLCPIGFSQGLRVHNIDTGLDFETIQEAINANTTLDGHTILVDEGVYFESVVVNKSISLVGEDKFETIIDGGGIGTVVKVKVNNVSIMGFTIQNSGQSEDSGICLNRTKNSVVNDSIVKNNYYGISLQNSDNNNVSLNSVFNNSVNGMLLRYSYENNVYKNNVFNNSFVGINLFPASRNLLKSNNVYLNPQQGIHLDASTQNTVIENNVWSNGVGLSLTSCFINVIVGNYLFNNSQFGLRFLGNSIDNYIMGNDFFNNLVAGVSFRDSSNNTVVQNNFLQSVNPVRIITAMNFFDNGLEGNYWSGYAGKDEDNDGVGDTAFIVAENNTDNFPLMGMFSYFNVLLEKKQYQISVVCNLTISGLQYNNTGQRMKFQIEGLEDVAGFCRVMIPNILMVSPHIVFVDGEEVESTLLTVSNITRSFIYFNVNDSQEVIVASRPFYDLTKLYSDLLADYLLLQEYYGELSVNYTELAINYTVLITQFEELYGNYSSLQDDFETLSTQYADLNNTLTDLVSQYDETVIKLDRERAARQIIEIATFASFGLSTFLIVFGLRYYRMYSKQKKMLEIYRRSPLEVGRLLFELDVKRRKSKIDKFEKTYGVKIQPRNTLEDLFRSLREKEEEDS